MDAIERVAEKLKLTYAASTFMPIPNAETGLWQDMARAAIEAMREPTEAMIEARKRRQATGTSLSYEQIIAEEFTAMIDAALNPQTSP